MESIDQSREWADTLLIYLDKASAVFRYWDQLHDEAHQLGPEKFQEKYGYPMGVVCMNFSIAQHHFFNL